MPELSLIIPSYNGAQRLRACLLALAQQTLPASDFEVIVVVDGSTDDTRAMLAALAVPYALNVIWQANLGQCAALNQGVAAARGQYCLFLDNDMVAAPQLAAEHLRVLRAHTGTVGIGQITLKLPPHADRFALACAQTWTGHYDRLNRGQRPPTWHDAYSGNLSVERSALLAAGGFAPDLPALFDLELGYRLHAAGLSFTYIPDARAEHDDYKDFDALAREAERDGRATVAVWRRHPATLAALLGGFGETTPRQLLLRQWLLRLKAGPRLMALLSRVAALRPWETDWYAMVWSYFFWRGVRQAVADRDTWERLTHRTPILMYHAFGAADEPASRFVIPTRTFAWQLACLKWLGYRIISLDQYVECRRAQQLPPARAVIITIDDAYADIQTQALPLLRQHAAPAVVFVVSGCVGGVNQWDQAGVLHGRSMLTWADLRGLLRDGLSIGAHTQTHPHLLTQPAAQVQAEIAGSRADLERALQIPIRTFAYPYGERDGAALEAAEQAGYWGACGVRRGLNSLDTPLFDLRRIEVQGTASLMRFWLSLWWDDADRPPHRSAAPVLDRPRQP